MKLVTAMALALVMSEAVHGEEMDHAHMDPAHRDHAETTPVQVARETPADAATTPHGTHDSLDDAVHNYLLINRLEVWDDSPGTGFAWEARGWTGTDTNRLWLRTEGSRVAGSTEAADVEALYGHSIAPWWDLVIGIRHDYRPGDPETFGAIGIQGTAPQWIELAATAYAGKNNQLAARIEIEHQLLFTNHLMLQPRIEANLHGKTDATRGVGAGLSTAEAGLRLRYEITRQFAPYFGVSWERAFGKTADLRLLAGENRSDVRAMAGLRLWF